MGRIILPNEESPTIVLPTVGMKGKYRLHTSKAKSGIICEDTGWFDNVITNVGLVAYWDLPSAGRDDTGDIGSHCCVGTGNTTPAVTDSSLANYLATDSGTPFPGGPTATGYVPQVSVPGNPAYVPPYWFARYIYTFGTGVAAGNLTEVGVFPFGKVPNGGLFSRALIVDGSGNPTAITVLSDEILTVTWELRYYLDVTDHAFTFNLNGSPITGTYRLYNAATAQANTRRIASALPTIVLYTGTVLASPLTGGISGQVGFINGDSTSGVPPTSYIQFVNDITNSGTCYADTKGNFAVGNGTGTIQSFSYVGHMWGYQFGMLSSPIIKTAGQQLQVSFRQVWGRYTG